MQKASCAAFLFSGLPPQAARADACRARPYEKVNFQGFGRGHRLMAFRFIEASSSLWPPERKQMPARNNPKARGGRLKPRPYSGKRGGGGGVKLESSFRCICYRTG